MALVPVPGQDMYTMTCQAVRLTILLLLPIRTNFQLDLVLAEGSVPSDLSKATEETCGPPPVIENTKPFDQSWSFPENCRLWYACIDGYVRKAGTSGLTDCLRHEGQLQWDIIPSGMAIKCIPNPLGKKTKEDPYIDPNSCRKTLSPRIASTPASVKHKTTLSGLKGQTTANKVLKARATAATTMFRGTTTTTATTELPPPEKSSGTTGDRSTSPRLRITVTATSSRPTTSTGMMHLIKISSTTTVAPGHNSTYMQSTSDLTLNSGLAVGLFILVALIILGAKIVQRKCSKLKDLPSTPEEKTPMS